MGTKFWVKRFLAVFVGAFVIIGAAQWLKGHDLPYSVTQAGIWGAISATIFTAARLVEVGTAPSARTRQKCSRLIVAVMPDPSLRADGRRLESSVRQRPSPARHHSGD